MIRFSKKINKIHVKDIISPGRGEELSTGKQKKFKVDFLEKAVLGGGGVLAEGLYEDGVGPERAVRANVGDPFHKGISGSSIGRAAVDGMVEGFCFGPVLGTGGVGVFVNPGGVASQVAFGQGHLLNSPWHELSRAHECVRS